MSRDVHQTGEDKRLVKLRDRVETRKPDKQVGKGSRKVLGLQEYWDHQGQKESCRSATNPEEQEDWDADVTPPLCPLAPGWKDLVSQLNQDPRAESISDSGIGATEMRDDVKSTAVKEDDESTAVKEEIELNAVGKESVKDKTICAVLDHSSRPDDLA